ncbi:MAG: hypothetical protein AB1668_01055 [Nanoarchaeota archaeon]
MKIENHLKNLKESLRKIDEAIKEGLSDNQRTIGFHTSAACADMLEILLHKKNLLPTELIIKHEWLASESKIKEKFIFDFDGRNEILKIISAIEKKRNTLCYGSPQDEEILEEIILLFNKAKNKFKELGLNEIE